DRVGGHGLDFAPQSPLEFASQTLVGARAMTTPIGQSSGTPEESRMEPREAARLLAQTEADARRSLDFRAPWVSLLAAVVALAGFGIVWLNVRDQHPFTGPSPVSLVFFYALIALQLTTVL